LANLGVNVPPRELVAKFDETVSPMVEQIRLSLEQNRTIASLRDHLLPKLLAGTIRLRAAEAVVEALA
jgi:type I restriction enzyme S subunit